MAELLARLSDDDPRVRLEAVLEVGALSDVRGHAALVEGVVRQLWHEHPGLREAALDMLGRLAELSGYRPDDRVVQRALELTHDERVGVRAEAATSMALLGADRPLEGREARLIELLEDAEARVRAQALAALGDLRVEAARDAIAARLEDADEEARFEAAFALASLADPRARPLLEAQLARTRRRLDACEGLRRLQDPAAIPALERVTKKWLLPWGDRLTVWATLHALGHPGAGAEVAARAHARRIEERTYALSLIGSHRIPEGRGALEASAADPKDPLRDTAVRALGALGDPASAPTLEAVLASAPEPELRADAEAALAALRAR